MTNRSLPLRLLAAVALSIGLALTLLLFLYVTDLALGVWARLEAAPPLFVVVYSGALLALAGGATWLIWRLWRRPRGRAAATRGSARGPLSRAVLEARIQSAEAQGDDVSGARLELRELAARRESGALYIALFGEVSAGKSSLIQALLPEARPGIGPRAGTTRAPRRYAWEAPNGTSVLLTDLPGVNGPDGVLEETAREEAQRAHLVLYLTEGDLTRRQYAEIETLAALAKPMVLVLNKMDYYRDPELEVLQQRLAERVQRFGDIRIVAISAGGRREVVKIRPDGSEEIAIEEVPARIEPLLSALQRFLRGDWNAIDKRRDDAVHALAAAKLDAAVASQRQQRAEAIIREHTRNAVIGALVAVSPGSDLVIQGYLGIALVRALCENYGLSVSELDIARFLKLAQARVRKSLPLILAVAGNAFKAFPGVGTLAGGVLHAVGYGLIFESLGHAVAEGLASQGDLTAPPTLRRLEEGLREDLEVRAKRLVQLVIAARTEAKADDPATTPRQ